MGVSLHTDKLPRASRTGKSKRGQLPARFRDRAGLTEDDFRPVTEDDMITEKQARFDLASSIPGYAAWFKANRPDEYAEWLKTGASDRITTSTATQPTETQESGLECEIQGILKLRDVLCLPAPKVEAVVTVDLTALVKVYEARSTPALRTFKYGDLVNIRNDRMGEVHMLMSNGLYRVWIMGGTGLRFRAIEYYTPEDLIALNPVVEQKKAA